MCIESYFPLLPHYHGIIMNTGRHVLRFISNGRAVLAFESRQTTFFFNMRLKLEYKL